MTKEKKARDEDIVIDYENIDVTAIMEQIRKKIASQPKKPEPENSIPPEYSASKVPLAPQPEEPSRRKLKIKNFGLKLMGPFSPIIKFLVLPVHQELKETIQNLYETNKRLDDHLTRIQAVNSKMNRVREYVHLLHNLTHNIVVELTKLKIEEESLKTTVRILEKDFEFLRQREKILEKKVFE